MLALSVIIPVWQEAATIVATLQTLAPLRASGHQVIVVDGGSTDGTPQLADGLCDRVVASERGRALQMNAGARVATGDILLFLHADTRLPASALDALARFSDSRNAWGRFDVRLSGRRPLFRVIAWFMNQRSRFSGIATGDQALFVRRPVFEALRGFEPLPLMEDVELSSRLRRVSRPFCIRDPVVTDSRRWEQHGAWRTILLMWRLRWRYWRGESPESLVTVYRSDVRNAHKS
ncbi:MULTISPECIES: TIGR04283 family arsenosugar biosynthesis glycosyltransferase [Marinobacter]|uniref:TIGR04283 family arsenosugar biosynthesis glycosyltransferase n=1 Tax=Marinobacter TaxID=2742 RepID=UPI0020030513|nr:MULTISPECIES: TIGR04283 family arsenosugar biosynthesis glycosyltransferase [Marinobacter]MCK7552690.1 TIGR04283 family arsenosugar biosynthesis glycosyltransferase [Marinobacter goseongensis]MDV3505403.1 TIGR04283 family arsenosugar biosynthesis glycosyltransferase [Marinobacter sp. M-5]